MKIIIDGKVVDPAETPVFIALECSDLALLSSGLHSAKESDCFIMGIVPTKMDRGEAIQHFNKADIRSGHHHDCTRGKTRIETII